MEPLLERIGQHIAAGLEIRMAVVDTLSEMIAKAAERLVQCLLQDGKLLVCGQGGSSANALHFSTAMLNRLDEERPPLPVITLSTDASLMSDLASDGNYDQLFARQIQAFGLGRDVLLILTTSGNSSAILEAVRSAHGRGMDVLALTGGDGGVLANHLGPEDIELRIPSDNPTLIRENHLFILHCFCNLIEQSLFGAILG